MITTTAPRPTGTPVRRGSLVLPAIAVGTLAVIGLLGWLLWPSPPSAAVLYTGTPHYAINATVDSPRIGTTDVTVDLTARDGSATAATVTVEAVMPLMGLATPAIPATGGGGHYTATGVSLMMTGPWELHVSITEHGVTDDLMLPFTVAG